MEDTNHTTLHKALEKGFNRALAPYEIVCEAVRKEYYTVSEEDGKILLQQPLLVVKCEGSQANDGPSPLGEGWITAEIELPTERENGTSLSKDELEFLECRVRDTDGQESDYTQAEINNNASE